MPDDETLAQMYGLDYEQNFTDNAAITDPKEPNRVVRYLKKAKCGTFLDYGCGEGKLLSEALNSNWKAIGIEYDALVAQATQQHTGANIVTDPNELFHNGPVADVLHLGDVIEHLTDLNHQMPEILKLVKPGGFLLAQGPLENNLTLFTLVLRVARSLRRSHRTEMAPYHILLASAKGQRIFFRRFGLKEVEFRVREVSWPAPDKLAVSDLKRPRSVGLFVLSRVSQMISALRRNCWGNRYFYIGQWQANSG